jgi:hypothetical protein
MVLDGDDEQSNFVVIRIGELHGLADKFRTARSDDEQSVSLMLCALAVFRSGSQRGQFLSASERTCCHQQ